MYYTLYIYILYIYICIYIYTMHIYGGVSVNIKGRVYVKKIFVNARRLYPEKLLVFRKDRNNITTEADKEVTFPFVTI